jgi:hypothetical protein
MSDTLKTVPCCGYTYTDDDYPVKWNQYNGVVQCHNCGETWLPRVQLSTLRQETIEECAKVCENLGKEIVCPEECAEALRALKEVKK